MKKLILLAVIFAGSVGLQNASAQLKVNLNVNIGNQPAWGPSGYDHVDYYYFPDIDVFYAIPQQQYIYQERGRWIYASALPPRYRHFNVNTGYKAVVNEPHPYRNAAVYRTKYSGFKGYRNQPIIRDSKEPKYFESKGNPQHNKGRKSNGHHN